MNEPSESEILLDVAVLGEQVEQFMNSDIGRYLLQHAMSEEQRGIEELKSLDCNDVIAMRRAQNRAWRGENFRIWLEEAIAAGLKARMILEDRED